MKRKASHSYCFPFHFCFLSKNILHFACYSFFPLALYIIMYPQQQLAFLFIAICLFNVDIVQSIMITTTIRIHVYGKHVWYVMFMCLYHIIILSCFFFFCILIVFELKKSGRRRRRSTRFKNKNLIIGRTQA